MKIKLPIIIEDELLAWHIHMNVLYIDGVKDRKVFPLEQINMKKETLIAYLRITLGEPQKRESYSMYHYYDDSAEHNLQYFGII